MLKINNHLEDEKCKLLDCENNKDGSCMCINMNHNPRDEVECDSYIPEE